MTFSLREVGERENPRHFWRIRASDCRSLPAGGTPGAHAASIAADAVEAVSRRAIKILGGPMDYHQQAQGLMSEFWATEVWTRPPRRSPALDLALPAVLLDRASSHW